MSTATQAQANTSSVSGTNGNFVWHELRTTDAKGAEDFYSHVIGWQTTSSGDPGGVPYKIFSVGSLGTAGLMQLTQSMLDAGMKPAWVGFIGVDDVDEYAKRVEKAGGKLHCAPQDIPTIGRFASAEDPQGAVFPAVQGLSGLCTAPSPVPARRAPSAGMNSRRTMNKPHGPFTPESSAGTRTAPWTWAQWALIGFSITAVRRSAR